MGSISDGLPERVLSDPRISGVVTGFDEAPAAASDPRPPVQLHPGPVMAGDLQVANMVPPVKQWAVGRCCPD